MMHGFSLRNYLLLVDYTARLFRKGKTAISAELAGILERLGTTAESWHARLEKLSVSGPPPRLHPVSRSPLAPAPRAAIAMHVLFN